MRSGGLSLITLPPTRERTCIGFCATMAAHTQEYGDGVGCGGGGSPHAIHCTSSPSWQSVKCSSPGQGRLTQIPGRQPHSSPLQTLGPFIPVSPRPSSHTANPGGTPHNGSVATVTDISMLLMFSVFFVFFFTPLSLLIFNKEGKKKKRCARETLKLVDNCISVPSFVLFMVPDRYFIFSLRRLLFEAKLDC